MTGPLPSPAIRRPLDPARPLRVRPDLDFGHLFNLARGDSCDHDGGANHAGGTLLTLKFKLR